jgi:ABC-2 type transport system ATP-binding protein
MVPAIRTERLSRQFGGKTAVDQVHLEVMPGTFYGFLGPNGAGKSTTIKMLTGLLQPSSGSIEVLGRNMLDETQSMEVKRSIGVIPENLALFDYLTAMEYLTFVGRIHGLDRDTIRQRSREMLDLLDLEDDSKKVSNDFSHGMRKKLSLAAALIHRPSLLFLDEPFEGVDAVASRTIRELLLRFTASGGTVFLTSHVLEVVERLCTHVGIIVSGQLVAQSSLEDLVAGGRLETAFIKATGAEVLEEVSAKLDWLTSEQGS